jgi:hypothetical protein
MLIPMPSEKRVSSSKKTWLFHSFHFCNTTPHCWHGGDNKRSDAAIHDRLIVREIKKNG